MDSSQRLLRLKIITGYVVLVLLFLLVLALYYREHGKLAVMDREAQSLLTRRGQTERIAVKLLDMALLGERIMAWDEEDYAEYKNKRERVTQSLLELRGTLPDTESRERIDSILALLAQKERYTFSVLNGLRELDDTYSLLQERIPDFVRQDSVLQERLNVRIGKDLEASDTGGFLGLFRSRKKNYERTERRIRETLQQHQVSSGELLRSLASEITQERMRRTSVLLARLDTLDMKNRHLNAEICHLFRAFNEQSLSVLQHATDIYLHSRKRALSLMATLGTGAVLLAILFYVLLHADLKRRERNRRALEHLNRRNTELLALRKNILLTVSHDLRAPLAAINNYAELLPGERRRENRLRYSEAIRQSSDRMLSLLNTLLHYYRLDTGKEQAECCPFRLRSLIDTLAAEYAPAVAAKRLEFITECDGGEAIVVSDRERILQIGSNLLSNAVKFTTGGHVRLGLYYTEGFVTLRVEDTGAGMTEEQTGRIFEPFARLGNAEAEEGFGLGLSITLALVKLLKGEITVQSLPGAGSTFTVRLPLCICTEENLPPQTAAPNTLPARLRVAVVDNDAMLRAMTTEMFTRHEAHAKGYPGVRELMEGLRTHDFDLILTDIMMPGVNGFGLLELLRTSNVANARRVPVMAMTARAERSAEEFIRAGFAGCLYKPFSRDELFAAVSHCIGKRENEAIAAADFSVLLRGEDNGREMLGLLVRETEKSMAALSVGLKQGDRKTLAALTHQLLPLWEVLQIDAPLKVLRQALSTADITDETLHAAVMSVLAVGRRLVVQAREQGGRL